MCLSGGVSVEERLRQHIDGVQEGRRGQKTIIGLKTTY